MRLAAIAVCLAMSGCASIINGTRQEVGVTSNPLGAHVKTSYKDFYFNPPRIVSLECITPCILKLNKKQSYILNFEKDGYENSAQTLTKSTSGWIWGNLLLGGPIGLGFDFGTGGAYKLKPENVSIDLQKKVAENVAK